MGHSLEESDDNRSLCEPFDESSHIESYKELALIYKMISQKNSGKINYEMLLSFENCNSFACKCPTCSVCRKKKQGFVKINEMENCSEDVGKTDLISEEKEQITKKKSCCTKNNSSKLIVNEEKCDEKKENSGNCEENKGNGCEKKEENLKKLDENREKSCENPKPKEKSSCFCKDTQKYNHSHSLLCGHASIIHNDHVDYIVAGQLHFPHDGHCDNHGRIYIH